MGVETPILEIKNLKKNFVVKKNFFGKPTKVLKAVNDVSLEIFRGETLGIVGESGCGKTTLGRTIMKLYDPDGGEVLFKGNDLTNLSYKEMLPYRKDIQMIFQDPYSSLNPRMTVQEIITEGIRKEVSAKEVKKIAEDLLIKVGFNSDHANRYPHEFSGGQRQRIGIARALSVEPELIICDEPISALDVSIQAQVVNMLEDLQKELGLTLLFIAHDLSMVKHISQRIGVMYLGKLVEITTSEDLFKNPHHPYTKALLSAIPIPDPEKSENSDRIVLKGDVPNPTDNIVGCPFKTRCPYVMDKCHKETPGLKEVGDKHYSACFLD